MEVMVVLVMEQMTLREEEEALVVLLVPEVRALMQRQHWEVVGAVVMEEVTEVNQQRELLSQEAREVPAEMEELVAWVSHMHLVVEVLVVQIMGEPHVPLEHPEEVVAVQKSQVRGMVQLGR